MKEKIDKLDIKVKTYVLQDKLIIKEKTSQRRRSR